MDGSRTWELLDAGAFRGERLDRPGTWVVAFLADWCPFCRALRTVLEEWETDGRFSMAVGDVTDDRSALWEVFRLEVVPTVVVFRDGAVVFRADGDLGSGLSARQLTEVRDAASGRPPRTAARD